MSRREIVFDSYDDVVAEIERLEQTAYRKLGRWSLGQICRHLSYYFRGSLEGYHFMLPWPIRKTLGRWLLRRLLKKGRMRAASGTIPASVAPDDTDDALAAAEAKELLKRLRESNDPPHPSPLFDRLTVDECRRLHLMHAAHHLGFLISEQNGP